ncbi:MAG: hypothetical protein Q4E43_04590 [Akkermansia sp.]|nr:hypothetical protein [Akkermansia sp.]
MLKHYFPVLAILSCVNLTMAAMVEAVGRAAGDGPSAREIALSDALREAVREGAGVDIVSESQVKDFALEFDRTFTKARGYVRKYEVVSAGITADGFYTVKIKADVDNKPLSSDDTMTFQMMAREYGAPRLSIDLKEQISGVNGSNVASDWLKNTAVRCGLKVVDLDRSQGNRGAMGRRAEILGRGQEAAMRGAGVVSSCDYLVEGEIVGDKGESKSYYGSAPVYNYSMGLNVRVTDAATGNVMLTETPPSRDVRIPSSKVEGDTAAARDAVRQLLEGSPRTAGSDAGWTLIRRIFAHWATEKDLGALFKMEFTEMDLAISEQLKNSLAEQQGLGAVWVRSVDPAGVSVVECESRIDALALARVIEKAVPGFKLDRSDNRYLSFRKGAAGAAAATAAQPVNEGQDSSSGGVEGDSSPLLYIAVGLGGVIVILLLIIVLKRKN